MFKCPGQDQRFWKPEDIFEAKCLNCGKPVEFFKDEPKLKCSRCKHIIVNPKIDLGCAQWCQYAEQCLGVTIKNMDVIRDRLIDEMRKVFGDDNKRIEHALAVLNYAEQIQKAEGGDPLVIKAAAILHDIGIPEAELKYGSAEPKYQEIEGPPIAKKILENYDLGDEIIEHICKIIANHHSARDIDTIEFRCVWDADWLVNIPENYKDKNKQRLQVIINSIFKTNTGHKMAMDLFVNNLEKFTKNDNQF